MKTIAAALLALAACSPALIAETAAPPGRTAQLDEVHGFWGTTKSYRLGLSRGVAIAITCNYGGPCEHMQVTSDAPEIAEIRPATLAVRSAAFVIVGKAAGTAHVHLTSKQGARDIAITIAPAPPDGGHAVTAAASSTPAPPPP